MHSRIIKTYFFGAKRLSYVAEIHLHLDKRLHYIRFLQITDGNLINEQMVDLTKANLTKSAQALRISYNKLLSELSLKETKKGIELTEPKMLTQKGQKNYERKVI